MFTTVRSNNFLRDGFVALFDDTTDAVEFAFALQTSLRDQPIPAGQSNVRARIAVHFDEILLVDTEYGQEIFGYGVNLAARLETLLALAASLCLILLIEI